MEVERMSSKEKRTFREEHHTANATEYTLQCCAITIALENLVSPHAQRDETPLIPHPGRAEFPTKSEAQPGEHSRIRSSQDRVIKCLLSRLREGNRHH